MNEWMDGWMNSITRVSSSVCLCSSLLLKRERVTLFSWRTRSQTLLWEKLPRVEIKKMHWTQRQNQTEALCALFIQEFWNVQICLKRHLWNQIYKSSLPFLLIFEIVNFIEELSVNTFKNKLTSVYSHVRENTNQNWIWRILMKRYETVKQPEQISAKCQNECTVEINSNMSINLYS